MGLFSRGGGGLLTGGLFSMGLFSRGAIGMVAIFRVAIAQGANDRIPLYTRSFF